jgi:hypothetical protein
MFGFVELLWFVFCVTRCDRVYVDVQLDEASGQLWRYAINRLNAQVEYLTESFGSLYQSNSVVLFSWAVNSRQECKG